MSDRQLMSPPGHTLYKPTTTSAQATSGWNANPGTLVPAYSQVLGEVMHSNSDVGNFSSLEVKLKTSNYNNQEISDSEAAFSSWSSNVEIAQPKCADGPAEIILQGYKHLRMEISGGGTILRWMVMDKDGLPLRNETGDIIWKEFPSISNSHVMEDKDHA